MTTFLIGVLAFLLGCVVGAVVMFGLVCGVLGNLVQQYWAKRPTTPAPPPVAKATSARVMH